MPFVALTGRELLLSNLNDLSRVIGGLEPLVQEAVIAGVMESLRDFGYIKDETEVGNGQLSFAFMGDGVTGD